MRIVSPLLAQNVLPTDVIAIPWHWMGLSLNELLALLGALALVTAILVIWAVYVRKAPRSHSHNLSHHRSHVPAGSSSSSREDPTSEPNNEKRHRRKRRRRREHRPRNPTLAETGGLPPLRSDQPPDSLP